MKFFYALLSLLLVSVSAGTGSLRAINNSAANADVPEMTDRQRELVEVMAGLSPEERELFSDEQRELYRQKYDFRGDGRCNLCDDDDPYRIGGRALTADEIEIRERELVEVMASLTDEQRELFSDEQRELYRQKYDFRGDGRCNLCDDDDPYRITSF